MLRPLPGSEPARVLGLLDAFQAAEWAGAEAIGRWIVACADVRLRGGLRVIRARDRRHAALAEAASAEVLAAWIAVCALDGLRGGLRVIAEREAAHAELLAERLGEMGVRPSAQLAEPVRAAAVERFGSAQVSDEQKLALFLAR